VVRRPKTFSTESAKISGAGMSLDPWRPVPRQPNLIPFFEFQGERGRSARTPTKPLNAISVPLSTHKAVLLKSYPIFCDIGVGNQSRACQFSQTRVTSRAYVNVLFD
jgi:hypothetical protein